MLKAPTHAVVLMNLGSPASPKVPDVRRYLTEFLLDKRVIDYPYIFRQLLVRGLIIPARVENSAHAYQTIWTERGSPLIVLTEDLCTALSAEMNIPVVMAMRYGALTPRAAFDAIQEKYPSVTSVTLVPLYPHYAMSSYETAVVHARKHYRQGKYNFALTIIEPFYDHPAYINALVDSMQPYLEQSYDHILFSYHGVPERHVRKGDVTGSHCLSGNCCKTTSLAHTQCYRHHCFKTTELVATHIDLSAHRFTNAFQSRLGRDPWLEPYTADMFEALPKQGVKNLLVICPAFISDCLETLEEIAVEGKKTFLEAGGENFIMIPCLNTHPSWVKALATLVNETSLASRAA
jgi:protoporphyrin/coproporphyrin ferrochelatase